MKTSFNTLLLVGALLLSIVSLSNEVSAQNTSSRAPAESYRVNKFLEWVKSHKISENVNTAVYDDQKKIIGRYYDVNNNKEDIRVIIATGVFNFRKIPYLRIDFKERMRSKPSVIVDYYLDGSPEVGVPSPDLIGRTSLYILPDTVNPAKSDDEFLSILIRATLESWQQEYDRILDLANK